LGNRKRRDQEENNGTFKDLTQQIIFTVNKKHGSILARAESTALKSQKAGT
jgi:hypothetical protein